MNKKEILRGKIQEAITFFRKNKIVNNNNKTLNSLLSDFENLEKNKWMSNEDIFRFFVNLFNRIQRDTMV